MVEASTIVRVAHPSDPGLEPAWAGLLDGRVDAIEISSGPPDLAHLRFAQAQEIVPEHERPCAIFPGAFNPLHHGHLHIAALSAMRLGRYPHFEISITNVDKATIERDQVMGRIEHFDEELRVLLTRAATFVEKANIFPGITFVVGADTMVRIDDPKYYASARARDEATEHLAELGCEFLVFGRHDGPTGEFVTLSDMDLQPALAALCHEVGEEEFRIDLSSSELRANSG